MKKTALLSMVIALIFLAILGLFACGNVEVIPTSPDEVTVTFSEAGISFSYKDQTRFVYSTDGGVFFDIDASSPISFSDTEGEHSVVINALDPADETTVLATAIYTYRTVPVSLSAIAVNGMTATWTVKAKETYLKVGDGEYALYTDKTYTAEDSVRISVRAIGGFDAANNVFYSGKSLTRSATLSSSYNALSSPEIVVNGDRLAWGRVDNASSYEISIDGGEYYAADRAEFSTVIGAHVFRVKAIGDGENYSDSEPTELRYTTTATSLVATKTTSDSASFTYVGLALARKVASSSGTVATNGQDDAFAYKNGFAYYRVDPTGFSARSSGTATFVAMAGFDSARNVYYPTESVTDVPFTVPASEPVLADSVSGWRAPIADGVQAGEKYDGTPSFVFTYKKDGTPYAYSYRQRGIDGYDLVSFDAKGDDLASVILRLRDSANDYTLAYPLGVLPAYWQRFSVSIADEGWLVNGEIKPAELLSSALVADPAIPAKYTALRSLSELIACFDTLEVVLAAASPDDTGTAEFGPIAFSYSDGEASSHSQPLFHCGNAYLLTEEIEGDEPNDVYLAFDGEEFRLYSTSLEENFYLTGSAYFDEAAAMMHLSGEDFRLDLFYTYNGYYLTADVGEGIAATYLNGKRFRLAADLTLTFDAGTAGEYVSDEWTSYYKSPTSDSYEKPTRPNMYLVPAFAPSNDEEGEEPNDGEITEDENENEEDALSAGESEEEVAPLVLSLQTVFAEIDRFVYIGTGRSLGIANAFSMKVALPRELDIKVVAIDVAGTAYYLIGTADAYETLSATDDYITIDRKLAEPIDLFSFYFEINNSKPSETVSLLVSEISFSYHAEVSAKSMYPLPSIASLPDRLEFSYDIPNVIYEYALDASKDFTEGERGYYYSIHGTEPGEHVLYVRALIGEEESPSKTVAHPFTVNAVTVSSVAVRIGEDGKHTATWTTNGICSIEVTRTVVTIDKETGDPVKTEEVVSELTQVTDYVYVTDRDVTLTVLAQGYYDQENNIYYDGTVSVEKMILVTSTLEAPTLRYVVSDGVEGVGWGAVDGAKRYSVQVNDAEAREQEECFFPFESGGSEYIIKVISIDEDGIAYSNAASFSYRVVPVSVDRLTRSGLTFSGKAIGRYAYASETNKAEQLLVLGERDAAGKRAFSYTVSGEGMHSVSIRIAAGYDDSASILYVGDDLAARSSVNISRIPRPIIRLDSDMSESVTGLLWSKEFTDGETGYLVEESFNGGEWQVVADGSTMVTAYRFGSVPGTYTVRVSAIGDNITRLSSESTEYSFTVRTLTLAPTYELTEDEKQVVLSVGSVALRTEIKEVSIEGSNDYAKCELSTIRYGITTTVYLRVFGGYDMENDVYYAGTATTWEDKLIVPTPLSAPIPDSSGNGVFWQKVKNAEYYLVTLEKYNGVSYDVIRDKERVEAKVGESSSSFPFEKENKQFVTGIYRMTILVSNSDLVQYPNDNASATFEYEVRDVTIGELTQTGNTVNWTYDAWALALYVDDELIGATYNKTTYTNMSGAGCFVRLSASEGYDAENHIRYIGSASTENFEVSYKQLLTPTLTATDTGLVWEEIIHANKYEVKVEKGGDVLSVTDYDECAYAFPSEVGSYVVSVSAVDRVGSFKGSDPAVFTFEVKAVSLSAISERVTGKTSREAYWTKVGKTSVSTDGEHYEPTDFTVYSPDDTTHYYVKCSAGFVSSGENEGTYYYGEEQSQDFLLVIPHFLKAPTLTLTASGIDVSDVDSTDGVILKVSHDGVNSDMPASTTLIPNSVTAGSHTITVTAYHSYEKQYPADDASCTVTYTVKEVSLTLPDAAYVVDSLDFTANGLVTVSAAGDLTRTYAATDSYVYTPAATVTVTVTAARGLDADHSCYYVGEADLTSSSVEVIIPIPLRAPTLKKERDNVTVSSVDHADGYEFRYTSDGGANWSLWTKGVISDGKLVYGSVGTKTGSYRVEVRAYSDTPVRYPQVVGSVATVSYDVADVSLSELTKTDNRVTWTATACETYYRKSASAQYVLTTDSSYTLTEAGEYSFSVRARRGYKESADTYYHASEEYVTSAPVSVTITKLATPTVSGGSSGVSWTAVLNAKGYKVRVNNGSYETVNGTTKSFSTTQGTYKVEVIAVGDDKTLLSSDAGSYTYTVKTVSLSAITISGRKASWTATALKTSYKVDNGSYTVTADSSYTLPSSYGAGTYTVTVKVEGGFRDNVYYYSGSATEKSGKITLTKLAAPTLTGGSTAVSWSKVSNASSYQSKTDSESYASNSKLSVSYSSSAGSHTVKVKAIASSSTAYVDSDEAIFSYTTKTPSLSFVSESSTEVSFTYVGVKAQYSTDGTNWKDCTLPGYSAYSASTVKFRAVGGYLSDAKVYYPGNSSVVSKNFSFSGQVVDSFESGSVSAWKKEKYTTSWSTANDAALEIVPDAAGGGNALKFTSFANGSAYKITRSIGTMNTTYHALAFDIRVNRFYPTVGVTIQIQDKESGIYITYPLTNISALNTTGDWYHVVISFNDENLKINIGGTDYPYSRVHDNIGKTQYKTWDNAIKAMDDISFIIKGLDSSYAAIYTYIDNIRLLSSGSSSATKFATSAANLEFNDGTAWASYTNSAWKKYEWTNGSYQASSKDLLQCQLDRNEGATNKVLSMYCGYSTYKYTYNEGGSNLGKANHLSIDLASWSSGVNINYRIILIDSNNKEIFLAGSSTGYATLTPTTKPAMRSLSFNFAETTVKSIVIIAQAGDNANLFADNIYLSKCTLS